MEQKCTRNKILLDKENKNVIAALQAHFRPKKAEGVIDFESMVILNNLIQQKEAQCK